MKKTIAAVLVIAAITTGTVIAVSQVDTDIESNGLTPSDPSFQEPIELSESDALTIVSFNIRDIRGTTRTLEDFQELARLMEGADIVVFQEMGAKGFKISGDNEDLMERLMAVTTVLESYLGDEWGFVFAPNPTPETFGGAAEIPCIGYRNSHKTLEINASWKGYFDLGTARDMGLFEVSCSNGSANEIFTIGTVHTKPTCPERGQELLRIADYIDANEEKNFIIMGDFNWGYKSTCENRYEGEERIIEQHEAGQVFQVFNSISYTTRGGEDDFRTNLDVRSTGQMYDQFLVSKSYADGLENGGSLGEDCGFVSFSTGKYFNSRLDDVVREQLNGVKAYMRGQGFKSNDPETVEAMRIAEEEIRSSWLTEDKTSYLMSDHKPIWMQINIF